LANDPRGAINLGASDFIHAQASIGKCTLTGLSPSLCATSRYFAGWLLARRRVVRWLLGRFGHENSRCPGGYVKALTVGKDRLDADEMGVTLNF
jgi:hypothetical protein